MAYYRLYNQLRLNATTQHNAKSFTDAYAGGWGFVFHLPHSVRLPTCSHSPTEGKTDLKAIHLVKKTLLQGGYESIRTIICRKGIIRLRQSAAVYEVSSIAH
jgi:hypothetical protein